MKKMVTLEARQIGGKVEYKGEKYDTAQQAAEAAGVYKMADDNTDVEFLVWAGDNLSDVITVSIKS